MPDTTNRVVIILAAAARDAAGMDLRPAGIVATADRILFAGSPDEARRWVDAEFLTANAGTHRGIEIIERPDSLLLPALVNAHAHLDLTNIGPQPLDGRSFTEWVDMIRERRPVSDGQTIQAVWQGIDKTLAGGTGIIGDIAGVGSHACVQTLAHRCLGVGDDPDVGFRVGGTLRAASFLEVFGMSEAGQTAAVDRLPAMLDEACRQTEALGVTSDRFLVGIQPHAPYSAGPRVYQEAARLARTRDLPVCTHLSETREEEFFVRSADGPFVDLLSRLGKWDDTIKGAGCHPIDHLAPVLLDYYRQSLGDELYRPAFRQLGWLCAHVNYLDAQAVRHIGLLREAGVTVAYCPHASAYFGHENHPYRTMLAAGLRVALGTDSIVCLDTPDRISVWDEMRLLYRRDQMEPDILLAMGTINGARALGFDPALVTLQPGPSAGIIAVNFVKSGPSPDPLAAALALDTDSTTIERII